MNIQKVRENMGRKNEYLSSYACRDVDAYRFEDNVSEDFRTPFYRDIDRIIYSLSYTRYMDKTQVFSFNENDNISKRMTHVQIFHFNFSTKKKRFFAKRAQNDKKFHFLNNNLQNLYQLNHLKIK